MTSSCRVKDASFFDGITILAEKDKSRNAIHSAFSKVCKALKYLVNGLKTD